MSSEIFIYVGFGLLFLVLFGLIYSRDAQSNSKFAKFELVLEGLIKENYQLKKQLNGQLNQPIVMQNDINLKDIYDQIDAKITDGINAKVIPMLESVKSIEKVIDDFQNDQQNRIYNLEERTKTISKITPPGFDDNDENRIIQLYSSGKSIENIARDLRLSVGRVIMVLKFHKVI